MVEHTPIEQERKLYILSPHTFFYGYGVKNCKLFQYMNILALYENKRK